MKRLILLCGILLLLTVRIFGQTAPYFTSTPGTLVDEDASYTYTAVAADDDPGDVLTLSAPTLPTWLSFTPETGLLTGVPDNDDVGDHPVTIRVNDGTFDVDQDFTITVSNTNDAPTFTSTPIISVAEDATYSYTATVNDVDALDVLTLSAPTLPTWLSFTPGTGLLTGVPDNDDVGDHPVVIRVNDGTVNVDQGFTITVSNENDPPTFTSSPITTVAEDATYSYTATVSDVDALDVLTLSAPTLPTWLSFTPATGILTGIPDNDDVGDHPVTIRVNDGTVNVDQSFTITVSNENDPPTFTSSPVISATEDVTYNYTATVNDVDVGDLLTLSAPTLPTWLSFTPATGLLTGVPDNGDVGDHPVTIRVNDGTVNVDQSFTITVNNANDPPTFTSSPITSVAEDATYSYTATASDDDPGDVLTLSAPTLPTWLSFTPATGLLTGIPDNDDVGDHPIVIRVNDGTVNVDQGFTITVSNENDAPTFTSSPITSALEDATYSYTATVNDVDVGDLLTLSAPTLPTWLSFTPATGLLTGVPDNGDVGDHPVIIRVNDGTVNVDQSFTITVNNANDPPTFTSSPITSVAEDATYSYTAAASDDDPGDVLTLSAPTLPTWLSFTPATGLLTGVPDNGDVGDHPVLIRVNDGTVNVDQGFTITVSNVNDAPTFTSSPITSALEDATYSYTATVNDVDVGDVLTLSAPTLPTWLSFTPATGLLTGVPDNGDVGDHPVVIRVYDGTVNVDQGFTITVNNSNDPPTFTSSPITSVAEDATYSYTATVSDVDALDVLTLSAPTLPTWLSFTPATGLLTGVPDNDDVGDHPVLIRVNDGTVDVDQGFTITVSNENDPPTFTSTPINSALEDATYSYTATVNDVDVGDVLTLSAPTLPTWLSFTSATGLLTGVPDNGDVGDHPVTIRVNDGTVNVDQNFTITVSNDNDPPGFTSTPLLSTIEDASYSYTATVNDVDVGDVLTLSAPTLPDWLSFTPGSGLLTGIPDNDDVGNHAVTIRVNDGSVNVDQDFTIRVNNTNDAPTFTSAPVISATEDIPYFYNATVSDVDVGDALTLSAPTLPDWLAFIPGSGLLTGTPENDDVGDHPVTIRVNDGTMDVDQDFTISVSNANDAPTFTSAPVTDAQEDSPYSYTVTVSDVDVGDVLTLSAPTLPGWLTFTPGTGLLAGTPTNDEVGSYPVTIRVNDGTVNVDQDFTITVANTNDAPTFTSVPVTSATEDAVYTYTATASDVDVGDILTLSAPILPGWLTFTPGSGLLTGTPLNEHVGDHPVVLRVNDGTVDVDQTFTITVINTNDPPAFTSLPLTTATQESPYSYTATAEDPDNDPLTYSAPGLPGWLDFDADSRVLSGTPGNDEVGDHNVTLRIFDGSVNVDQSFTISVGNINDAPTFTSSPNTSATEDALYSYTATAIDIDGDYISFRAPTLPPWLTFDTTTHVLSGTPGDAEVGNHNVTLRISDGSLSEDQTFVIEVANINDAPTFTSLPLTTGTQDALYSYTVTAEDVDGDSIIFRAPVRPLWLTFNDTTHVLSGTPANDDVGIHAVTLRITDGTAVAEQIFEITVGNENDAPEYTSIPDTSATQGTLYTYAVTAEDIDGDTLSFSAPTLPAWLSFDDVSNVLSGTPENEHVGDHPVAIRANDGAVDVDQSWVITVQNINDAPTFVTVPDTVALQGTLYEYAVAADDIDEDSIRYSAPALPGWLAFDDVTRILSGTPGNDDVGDNPITLRINDGTVDVDSSIVIVVGNINDAPVFLSIPDTEALQGDAYESEVTAEDIDGDTLIFTAPTLPPWLSFNDTTHVLSGTPTNDDVGVSTVTLRINDGTVGVDTSFVINVGNVNDAPSFISIPDTIALEDAFYSYTAIAEDIDGDTLSFSAPVIPLWLSFNESSNVLSGIPDNDQVGEHSVALTINDGTEEVFQVFTIVVENTNDPPTITSTPVTEARPGVAYSYTVTAIDIDGDALSYSALVLPSWLTFNSVTHTLSATPGENDVGDQHVTIRVSDGSLHTDHTFVISVGFANHAPTFTSEPATSVEVGNSYVYTLTAQDIDGDELTFSAPSLPGWLTFYQETNVISGTPASGHIGRHDVTVRVSDGTVSSDQNFPIFVQGANSPPSFISTPVTQVTAGELYVYYAEAQDPDEDDLTYSAPVLPVWLNFDQNTRTLHGTPSNAHAGVHNVSLRVSDGRASENQIFVITVEFVDGIEELSSEDGIRIYPNPTDGRFLIELSREVETEITLEIMDPAGRLILQQVYPPFYLLREEYNLSEHPPGIYFIRIYDKTYHLVKKLMLY